MRTFIAGDKLKYHPSNVAEYMEKGFSTPICVQFQITNKCPFFCIYCDKIINSDESEINDKFINRLNELKVKSIVLTGGEPVLYSRFNEDVPRLSQYFKLGLVTTLIEYKEELQENFQWIKVSIDSVDELKYKKIRRNNKLKQVLDNLQILWNRKNPFTKIGTQIVLTDDNKSKDDLENFIKTVYEKCDYIQIRPIEAITPHEYTVQDIEILLELRQKYEKIILSEKFYYRCKPIHCKARWTQLTIDVNHNVLLCCNRIHEKIGNLYDENLLMKNKDYKIDFSKCYTPCIMSSNNYYLDSIENGIHKDFI